MRGHPEPAGESVGDHDVELAPLIFSAERLSFRWYLALPLLAWIAAGALSPLYTSADRAALLVFSALVPLTGLYFLRARNIGMMARAVEIEISPRELVLRPGPSQPRNRLVRGSYSQAGRSYWVKLERRAFARPLWLRVAARDDARRLLDALGLGPAQSTFSTRVGSRIQGTGAWSFGAVGIMIPFGAWLATTPFLDQPARVPLVLACAGAVTLVCWVVALMPTRVDIDAMGVRLTWFWRTRTVPFKRVAHVRARRVALGEGNYVHAVELQTGLGHVTRLALGHNMFGGAERASALQFRLEDALENHLRGSGAAAARALELLSRDD